jgi:hypothetical protein
MLYLPCWGQVAVTGAKTAARSFLGKGLEFFSNPAYIEASGFSKNLCASIPSYLSRNDYACWFERDTAMQNVSMEEAAKREAPKILFSDLQRARDGTDIVQFTLCTNDDPTKPKEYSKGCKRGHRATITEYGRGDFNNDNVEDILVMVKFGENTDQRRKCYMAAFMRKDNDYFKLISYSIVGLCEQ